MSTDSRHGFEDGSFVTFHGVQGMTEVNGQEFQITVPSNYEYRSKSITLTFFFKVHTQYS